MLGGSDSFFEGDKDGNPNRSAPSENQGQGKNRRNADRDQQGQKRILRMQHIHEHPNGNEQRSIEGIADKHGSKIETRLRFEWLMAVLAFCFHLEEAIRSAKGAIFKHLSRMTAGAFALRNTLEGRFLIPEFHI